MKSTLFTAAPRALFATLCLAVVSLALPPTLQAERVVIPIADRHLEYADHVMRELKQAGLRVEVDTSGERMGNMIRRAQLQKVPYMLVIGDREAEAEQVAVRDRSGDDLGAMPVFQVVDRLVDERDTKSYQPPV